MEGTLFSFNFTNCSRGLGPTVLNPNYNKDDLFIFSETNVAGLGIKSN